LAVSTVAPAAGAPACPTQASATPRSSFEDAANTPIGFSLQLGRTALALELNSGLPGGSIVRKIFQSALIAFTLGVGTAQAADIVVRIAPPRAVLEHRGAAPGRGYVWVPGWHRWEGNHYVWERGRWEMPPRPHAVWVAPKWNHRHGEYFFVEGHWR
jgi:hypothetical protein